MDQVQINNIAVQSLKALHDERVMLPSTSVEAVSDLKSILRGLVNNTLMIVPRPTAPAQEPAGEPDD
jgi:hypothetical protein